MPAPKQPANTDPAEGSRKVIDHELERQQKPDEPGKPATDHDSDSEADERAEGRGG